MNPVAKKKFASSEDLFQEIETIRQLPKAQWIDRINNLGLKQLVQSNQSLLISEPNESLVRLTQLKKRLKKIPSENQEKQAATVKVIVDSIDTLANLSPGEDEESSSRDVVKDLEGFRKLPKDQWVESINKLKLKLYVNKNINSLLENSAKALSKLSQILNRLKKEPSKDEEAQNKVKKAVSRAIELVSTPSDDEEEQASSSQDIPLTDSLALSTTSAYTLLQSTTAVDQSVSKPLLNTASVTNSKLLPSSTSKSSTVKPVIIDRRGSLPAIDLDDLPWLHKLPIPLEGTALKAVTKAIVEKMENVNLSKCPDLDDALLEHLFNENPAMKVVFVESPKLTRLPSNDKGYACVELYCHYCGNLKTIDYNSYPNLEVVDLKGCQSLISPPYHSKKIKALNIANCFQFDLSEVWLDHYPNIKFFNQRHSGNPDQVSLQTHADIKMWEEIWEFGDKFQSDSDNDTACKELLQGVRKIQYKWGNQLAQHAQYKAVLMGELKRTMDYRNRMSEAEEKDLEAQRKGRPHYWRKIDEVSSFIHLIDPEHLRALEPIKQLRLSEEAYYDRILRNFAHLNPKNKVETKT